jgi:hypothetical protein
MKHSPQVDPRWGDGKPVRVRFGGVTGTATTRVPGRFKAGSVGIFFDPIPEVNWKPDGIAVFDAQDLIENHGLEFLDG